MKKFDLLLKRLGLVRLKAHAEAIEYERRVANDRVKDIEGRAEYQQQFYTLYEQMAADDAQNALVVRGMRQAFPEMSRIIDHNGSAAAALRVMLQHFVERDLAK